MKIDGFVHEEKLSFKTLGLTFSSKLDWGSYIIFIAKIAPKRIEALIFYMKFLSPEVALYRFKSTIWPCMEYCCHVWACAPICHLEFRVWALPPPPPTLSAGGRQLSVPNFKKESLEKKNSAQGNLKEFLPLIYLPGGVTRFIVKKDKWLWGFKDQDLF